MKGVPHGRYTKEFREEAVKLVTEGNLSLPEAARRLSDCFAVYSLRPIV